MTAATTSARRAFAAFIAFLRSIRSISVPAGMANSSHGRNCTADNAAISTGSRVSVVASSGKATLAMPSARFDMPLEASSQRSRLSV